MRRLLGASHRAPRRTPADSPRAWRTARVRLPSRAPWAALLALLALGALTLAGCSLSGSGGSSGSSITLGLSGATADNGGGPPTIATGGPSQTYAFVYNSQVWAHVQGASAPVQLTHLALSNGATLRWGPLVWSANNKYLAFALVQNLTPSQPTGSSGPLYYIDTTSCLTDGSACPVIDTAGMGSVYGHSYDWYQDDMLVYGSGQGLTFYDVVNPNGARVWQARTVYNDGTLNSIGDYACGSQSPRSYGDVEVINQTLYYTCMSLTNIGASDVVGSAILMQLDLSPIGAVEAEYDPNNASTAYTRDTDLGTLFNNSVGGNALTGSQVIQLGSVYVDQQGDYIAGAWQVRNTTLAYQIVNKVDTTKGTVNSQLCESQVGSGGCDNTILSNADTLPLTVHPQFAIESDGTVALTADNLYILNVNATVPSINWPAPAMWENGVVVFTQLVKETTDGSGVTRDTTNVVITKSGQTTILIPGGSNLAFQGFQS
ncbi:MAG TPA: hypothetical protein VMV29_12675 [Ktedonobacterales bacterium]|nr:hypothetical protein [Ktedonobacterales bacterium]